MDAELEGPGKLKRKGERRTSSRPRKRHAATVRAPGAGASQKEECRAVIRSLLSSLTGSPFAAMLERPKVHMSTSWRRQVRRESKTRVLREHWCIKRA